MKKLTKGIEESKKEKERLAEEREKLKGNFKEIEQKAFAVQKNYEKTEEVLFLVLLLFWLYKLCGALTWLNSLKVIVKYTYSKLYIENSGGGGCMIMYCLHNYVDD